MKPTLRTKKKEKEMEKEKEMGKGMKIVTQVRDGERARMTMTNHGEWK